jgi:hypothetical protein
VSPYQGMIVADGRILSAFLQELTRYSASVPQFPANDRSPFEVSCSWWNFAAERPGVATPGQPENALEFAIDYREVGRVMSGSTWLRRTLLRSLSLWKRALLSHCPSCVTPMSARKIPVYKSQNAPGGWLCPHCGTIMDARGRSAESVL